jgi:hypothetical protein
MNQSCMMSPDDAHHLNPRRVGRDAKAPAKGGLSGPVTIREAAADHRHLTGSW